MIQRVLAIDGDTMGRGDEALGGRLMVKFIHQLPGVSDRPHAIVFYNTGVRLLADRSVVLDTLRQLEHDGVELLACGTCVAHFGLEARLAVGRVTDMREIAATLTGAERVVRI